MSETRLLNCIMTQQERLYLLSHDVLYLSTSNVNAMMKNEVKLNS